MKLVLFSFQFSFVFNEFPIHKCDRLLCCYRTMSKWAISIDWLFNKIEWNTHTSKSVHIQSNRKSESYWLMISSYALVQQPMFNSHFGAITIELGGLQCIVVPRMWRGSEHMFIHWISLTYSIIVIEWWIQHMCLIQPLMSSSIKLFYSKTFNWFNLLCGTFAVTHKNGKNS